MKTNPATELTSLIMEFPVEGDLSTTMAYKAMMLVKLADYIRKVEHLTKGPIQYKGEVRVPTIAGELMCFPADEDLASTNKYVRFIDPEDDSELAKFTMAEIESDATFHLGAFLGALTYGAKIE